MQQHQRDMRTNHALLSVAKMHNALFLPVALTADG